MLREGILLLVKHGRCRGAWQERFRVCRLPVAAAGDEYVARVIYFIIIFFSFPLASSSNACVGLLISEVLLSGETRFSSSPKSAGSSAVGSGVGGRMLSRGRGASPPGVPARAPGSSLVIPR